MDIKAFKMDGLGNDFVIIDNRQTITNLTKEQIIKICDRKFIGCEISEEYYPKLIETLKY